MGNGQFGVYLVGTPPTSEIKSTESTTLNRTYSGDYDRVLYKKSRFAFSPISSIATHNAGGSLFYPYGSYGLRSSQVFSKVNRLPASVIDTSFYSHPNIGRAFETRFSNSALVGACGSCGPKLSDNGFPGARNLGQEYIHGEQRITTNDDFGLNYKDSYDVTISSSGNNNTTFDFTQSKDTPLECCDKYTHSPAADFLRGTEAEKLIASVCQPDFGYYRDRRGGGNVTKGSQADPSSWIYINGGNGRFMPIDRDGSYFWPGYYNAETKEIQTDGSPYPGNAGGYPGGGERYPGGAGGYPGGAEGYPGDFGMYDPRYENGYDRGNWDDGSGRGNGLNEGQDTNIQTEEDSYYRNPNLRTSRKHEIGLHNHGNDHLHSHNVGTATDPWPYGAPDDGHSGGPDNPKKSLDTATQYSPRHSLDLPERHFGEGGPYPAWAHPWGPNPPQNEEPPPEILPPPPPPPDEDIGIQTDYYHEPTPPKEEQPKRKSWDDPDVPLGGSGALLPTWSDGHISHPVPKLVGRPHTPHAKPPSPVFKPRTAEPVSNTTLKPPPPTLRRPFNPPLMMVNKQSVKTFKENNQGKKSAGDISSGRRHSDPLPESKNSKKRLKDTRKYKSEPELKLDNLPLTPSIDLDKVITGKRSRKIEKRPSDEEVLPPPPPPNLPKPNSWFILDDDEDEEPPPKPPPATPKKSNHAHAHPPSTAPANLNNRSSLKKKSNTAASGSHPNAPKGKTGSGAPNRPQTTGNKSQTPQKPPEKRKSIRFKGVPPPTP